VDAIGFDNWFEIARLFVKVVQQPQPVFGRQGYARVSRCVILNWIFIKDYVVRLDIL
jgi:hypothetical protein